MNAQREVRVMGDHVAGSVVWSTSEIDEPEDLPITEVVVAQLKAVAVLWEDVFANAYVVEPAPEEVRRYQVEAERAAEALRDELTPEWSVAVLDEVAKEWRPSSPGRASHPVR